MSVLTIALMIVMFAIVVTSTVLWVMAIYGAFTRTDLKENRWLWVVLLLFFAPIGIVAYFFVENRKRLGILALVMTLLVFIGIPLLMVASLAGTSLHAAQQARERQGQATVQQ